MNLGRPLRAACQSRRRASEAIPCRSSSGPPSAAGSRPGNSRRRCWGPLGHGRGQTRRSPARRGSRNGAVRPARRDRSRNRVSHSLGVSRIAGARCGGRKRDDGNSSELVLGTCLDHTVRDRGDRVHCLRGGPRIELMHRLTLRAGKERRGSLWRLLPWCWPQRLLFSGHAIAAAGNRGLSVGIDAVHVIAAGSWLGCLLTLTVVGVPAAFSVGSSPAADAGTPGGLSLLAPIWEFVQSACAGLRGARRRQWSDCGVDARRIVCGTVPFGIWDGACYQGGPGDTRACRRRIQLAADARRWLATRPAGLR